MSYVADLSLFRGSSNARRHQIVPAGGDVYMASSTPSDMATLWGESFGSKERKFLRELLASQTICFSLKDTYQIHVRTLWHPASIASAMNLANGLRRQGKFALLLHDLVGDLTTSWTWAKFIRPLYRKGFSVIVVDLPGFGRSSVSQVPSCSLEKWKGQQSHVISKIMEELSVARCQILAVGQTCGILLHMLLSSPHRMSPEHVLINPIFDRNHLFAHVGIDPPPGAKAGWQDVIKEKQQNALIEVLRITNVRLWVIYEKSSMYRDRTQYESTTGGRAIGVKKSLQKEWDDSSDTYEMLLEASKNEFIQRNLSVTEITKADLCEAQCGKRIAVRMYIPSRHLKSSVARFMANFESKPWQLMFKPNHVQFQTKKKDMGTIATHLNETRFDDDESDSDDGRVDKSAKRGLTAHATRAMGQIADRSMVSTMVSQEAECKDSLKVQQAQDRADEALEVYQKGIESTTKRDEQFKAREMKKMGASASDGALRRQSVHCLSNAGNIARKMHLTSGAGADPAALSVTADARRDQKAMAWTSVPFEADLSYGVRKMYLDAFEASVESYSAEQEASLLAKQAHDKRTGFVVHR